MRVMREFAPSFELALRLRKQVRRQAREVVSLEQRLIVAHRVRADLVRVLDDVRLERDLLWEVCDPVARDGVGVTLEGLRRLRASAEPVRAPRAAP